MKQNGDGQATQTISGSQHIVYQRKARDLEVWMNKNTYQKEHLPHPDRDFHQPIHGRRYLLHARQRRGTGIVAEVVDVRALHRVFKQHHIGRH